MASIAPDLHLDVAQDDVDQGLEGTEAKRWLFLLGVPFVIGGALFATAIGTGHMWILGPASLFGPGAIILGFTYLGLSSDTNRLQ